MRRLEDNEIKDCIFNILCAFRDFCDENKLTYFLCAGTLLGAIRHQDFIPWDDDIDVHMPRPDYERFLALTKQKKIKDNYRVISWGDEYAWFPFCKIQDLNTVVDEKCSTGDKYLWIDIFPLDGLPDSVDESDDHLNKSFSLKGPYGRSIAKIGRGKTVWRAMAKLPLLIVPKIRGYKYYADAMHTLGLKYKYEESNYAGLVVWPYGPCERMKKSDIFPLQESLFRNESFKIASCWDSYLQNLYGDYMVLPPENKRFNHQMIAYQL